MAKKGKVVIILLILLAAVSILLSGIIYLMLDKEREHSVSLSKKISELEADRSGLNKLIIDHKLKLSQASAELNQSEKKIRELKFSLDKEKRDKQEALSQLASFKNDLDEAKSVKLDLDKEINQKKQEINSFKLQIERLDKANKGLAKKLEDISSSDVQLGKIVVASEVMPFTEEASVKQISNKSLEGRILVVNKEYAFAVVNLGRRDGIAKGDIFSIYQKGKYIGDVIVEKIDEVMSSVNFSDPDLKDIIQEGDKVATKFY